MPSEPTSAAHLYHRAQEHSAPRDSYADPISQPKPPTTRKVPRVRVENPTGLKPLPPKKKKPPNPEARRWGQPPTPPTPPARRVPGRRVPTPAEVQRERARTKALTTTEALTVDERRLIREYRDLTHREAISRTVTPRRTRR